MMKRYGFTIIECLIYLCCSSLLIVVTVQSVFLISCSTQSIIQKTKQNIQRHLAADMLISDLRLASKNSATWKVCASQHYIWQVCESDYRGWLCDNHTLIRYAGTYDDQKKVWRRASKNVMARDVENFVFHFKKQGDDIAAISYTLVFTNQATPFNRCVKPRNSG